MPGEERVRWELYDPDSQQVVMDTSVVITTEPIVWPDSAALFTPWAHTSQWQGVKLAEAWFIDRALVDFIVEPSNRGTFETIHPDTVVNDGNDIVPAATDSDDGDLSMIELPAGSAANGFTLELDYAFEQTRGPNLGYVQGVDKGYRLGFIGNSGVKFGGIEIAILDMEAMVELAGGIAALNPATGGGIDTTGVVSITRDGKAYRPTRLHELMTGVRYSGDYRYMTDWGSSQTPPQVPADYYDILYNCWRRPNRHMAIDVTPQPGGTYLVEVSLDHDYGVSYTESGITLGQFTSLGLQSHWGSGVVFSNVWLTTH